MLWLLVAPPSLLAWLLPRHVLEDNPATEISCFIRTLGHCFVINVKTLIRFFSSFLYSDIITFIKALGAYLFSERIPLYLDDRLLEILGN